MSTPSEEPLPDITEKETIFHSIFDSLDESTAKNPLWIPIHQKSDAPDFGKVILISPLQKKAKAIGYWVKRFYFLFENYIGYASTKNVAKIKKYISLEGLKVWVGQDKKAGGKGDEKERADLMLGFFRCSQFFMLKATNEETVKEWLGHLRKRCIMINMAHFYTMQVMLGRGSYGKVFLIQNNEDQKQYAVKLISKNQMVTRLSGFDTLFNEIKTLRKMNHQNIVKLKEVYETPSSLYLVMDYIEGEELKAYLQKKNKLSDQECIPIMRSILETLVYLDETKIVHRDLKLENILIPAKNPSEAKVIDFGLAIDLSETQEAKRGGTPGYIAPEVLKSESSKTPVTSKCDMFSLGCLFYRLLTGGKLFNGTNAKELLHSNKECIISQSKIAFLIKSTSAKDLLNKMLEVNPNKRISAAEALQHPFFFPEKAATLIDLSDCAEDINISPTIQYSFDLQQIKESRVFSNSKVFDSNGTICMGHHIPLDNKNPSGQKVLIPMFESSFQSLSGFGANYAGESSMGSCMTPTRMNFDESKSNVNSPSHSPGSRIRLDMKQKGYSPMQKSSFSNTLARRRPSQTESPQAIERASPGSKRPAVTGGFSDYWNQMEQQPVSFGKKLIAIGEAKDTDSVGSNPSSPKNL